MYVQFMPLVRKNDRLHHRLVQLQGGSDRRHARSLDGQSKGVAGLQFLDVSTEYFVEHCINEKFHRRLLGTFRLCCKRVENKYYRVCFVDLMLEQLKTLLKAQIQQINFVGLGFAYLFQNVDRGVRYLGVLDDEMNDGADNRQNFRYLRINYILLKFLGCVEQQLLQYQNNNVFLRHVLHHRNQRIDKSYLDFWYF